MSNPLLHKTFRAGAAIAAARIVKMTGADQVAQSTGPTDTVLGVNDDTAPVLGENVDVIMAGVAFVEAGAAFAINARLASDAQGRAVTAAPAAGTNNNCIGFAVDAAAAAGDIVRVLIAQHSFQG